VTDSPVLSPAETRTAESLLGGALGTQVTIRGAEPIWSRSHIVRLYLAPVGGSVVLKRRREDNFGGRNRAFGAEVAALDFLNGMDTAVAPRLLGADGDAEILIMEDLGAGSSLAHSLLARDRHRAEEDLVSFARALATMHSWSIGRSAEFAGLRACHAPGEALEPDWMGGIARGRESFPALLARLGMPDGGTRDEIESIGELLRGAGVGLVHSDPCPDNTHIADGACRIFDFETSGWGPVALDTAYLLAPFPSCWCFASLPRDTAGPAVRAYRDAVAAAGIALGPDWDAAMTAALAGWVVARAKAMEEALDEDEEWGTTTTRPRVLTWLRSFTESAALSGALPRLRLVALRVLEQLSARWPDTVVPDYPALARPGTPDDRLARVPTEWEAS
jgi:Ser/Thr protein kinase RdoA (MazF antagonist)